VIGLYDCGDKPSDFVPAGKYAQLKFLYRGISD